MSFARRYWKPEEDQILRDHFSDGRHDIIARLLPYRSPESIRARAKVLKLALPVRASKAEKVIVPPRTACGRGHEYNEQNTRLSRSGDRVCRICRREISRQRSREWRAAQKQPKRSRLFDSSAMLELIALALPRRRAA